MRVDSNSDKELDNNKQTTITTEAVWLEKGKLRTNANAKTVFLDFVCKEILNAFSSPSFLFKYSLPFLLLTVDNAEPYKPTVAYLNPVHNTRHAKH